jgi:hypothetical protein
MGYYAHSKQYYSAIKRREINRMIDQQSYGYSRTPSPAQKRVNEAVAEVRFTKKPHNGIEPVAMSDEDVETGKRLVTTLKFAKLNEQHSRGEIDGVTYSNVIRGWAQTLFPGDKDALSKFIALHHDEMAAKLRKDYAAAQKQAALGDGAAGTDQLIYGPNWRPAVQNDSPAPIGTASPTQDGTMSAAPNAASRSAADGTPPAASSAYVGKAISRDMFIAIAKQTMAGVYSKVRAQLIAMDQWPIDWIDSALIRHERGQ